MGRSATARGTVIQIQVFVIRMQYAPPTLIENTIASAKGATLATERYARRLQDTKETFCC